MKRMQVDECLVQLTVILVDTPDRIDTLLALVDEVLPNAVAVTKQVQSVRYLPAPPQ